MSVDTVSHMVMQGWRSGLQDSGYGVAYMRPPKLLASLQAHDITRYRESDGVGHRFGKTCSLA